MKLSFESDMCISIVEEIEEEPTEVAEAGIDQNGHFFERYFGESPYTTRRIVTITIDADRLEGFAKMKEIERVMRSVHTEDALARSRKYR